MTSVLILSCLLWVKGDFTDIIQAPVDEYGMVTIEKSKFGFEFNATVVEERMNSVKIEHPATRTSAYATSLGYEQKTLMTKLTVGDEEATLDCDIRRESN